jgi:hypothetical protein
MILRMSLRGGEHGRTLGGLLFEVVLIAVGVFLALWANNWHEDREHRAQAKTALRNFLGEMEANRDATQSNRSYHETLVTELTQFLKNKDAPASKERFEKEVHFLGLRPVTYEHTSWDLALATQALSYLKPELAFDISKVYTDQNDLQALENSFLSSTFRQASTSADDSMRGLAPAMVIYLIDVNQKEPAIISRYEKVIPEVRSALGVKPDR